jgi:hypothetical protein
MIKRIDVDSSALASIGYDPNTRALEVEFESGAVYRYARVPRAIYDELMAAASRGHYFSTRIRDHYRFMKVRSPRAA